MKARRLFRAALLAGLAVLALFSASCEGIGKIIVPEPTPTYAAEGGFSVEAMSLGKADCLILDTKDHLAVIDLGVRERAEEIATAIAARGKAVDALIITHYDKDHIGAAKKVLNSVTVKNVYLPEYDDEKSENASEVKGYLAKHQIEPITVSETLSFRLDEVEFTVYHTDIFFKRNDEGSNESSLCVTAKHGENLFLFAGDAVGRRLPEILSQLPDPSAVDWLKVPHHGVYDDNSESFIRALSARYAVICCSNAESADKRVLTLLEDGGAEVFTTDLKSVLSVSDGSSIEVKYL